MSKILCEGDEEYQIRGDYIRGWNGKVAEEGYCAMGLLACSCDNIDQYGDFKENEFTFLKQNYGVPSDILNDFYDCPSCRGKDKHREGLITTIVHLNDYHEKSYKQIAKWLKTLKL